MYGTEMRPFMLLEAAFVIGIVMYVRVFESGGCSVFPALMMGPSSVRRRFETIREKCSSNLLCSGSAELRKVPLFDRARLRAVPLPARADRLRRSSARLSAARPSSRKIVFAFREESRHDTASG